MNIEELRQAIERVASINHGEHTLAAVYEQHDDRCQAMGADEELIADCFTDPAEITRERLEAMGGTTKEGNGVMATMTKIVVGESALFFNGASMHARVGPEETFRDIWPRPKTMGDVARLLERLGREGR